MPNAFASPATRPPMRPRPTTPSLRPSSVMPSSVCQSPARIARSSRVRLRAEASISAKHISTVAATELPLDVCETTIPRLVAAA